MSAYIESKAHIDALVRVAFDGPVDALDVSPGNAWYNPFRSAVEELAAYQSRDGLGQMLIRENIASVQYRYRGEDIDTLPGPIDKGSLLDYQYAPGRPLTIGEALLAIDGYAYQTCEHPEWPTSDAYRFCDDLRHAVYRRLPEYRAADTWSIG